MSKMSTQAGVAALKALWNRPENLLEKIFIVIGSVDEADEYLDLMDSEETDDPNEVWAEWCRQSDREFEADDNPF